MLGPGPAAQPIVHARIANTPVNASDELYVTIEAFDGSRVQWGPCPWSPASALPERGDDCLVMFDEQDTPWVMVLAPIESSGYLDGGKPDSVYTSGVNGGGV